VRKKPIAFETRTIHEFAGIPASHLPVLLFDKRTDMSFPYDISPSNQLPPYFPDK
jgi:hypothetical protein